MAPPTPEPAPPAPQVTPHPPPPPPGPEASREEWHAWRHQQRDYARAQWRQRGWYGWPGSGWRWFWPGVLIVLGIYFLLSNLGLLWWLRGDIFWPVVLILLGVWLLLSRGRWWGR